MARTMLKKTVTLKISKPATAPLKEAWMIVPRPVTDWHSRCVSVQFDHVNQVHEIEALNSRQHAYLLKPESGKIPRVQFEFVENDSDPDPWIWLINDNRYTRASPELRDLAGVITGEAEDDQTRVALLIEHAAVNFGYVHSDVRFNDGHDQVPMLCGTAKGSCVDINTYLIAASRSMGIKVQYMAGFWFHPDKQETLDMHCWLTFECEGKPLFWDLAHHLKWGIEPLAPGLNPAGGRRLPMTCGRGLEFATANGRISISHFSEPLWVLASGECIKPEIRIHLEQY